MAEAMIEKLERWAIHGSRVEPGHVPSPERRGDRAGWRRSVDVEPARLAVARAGGSGCGRGVHPRRHGPVSRCMPPSICRRRRRPPSWREHAANTSASRSPSPSPSKPSSPSGASCLSISVATRSRVSVEVIDDRRSHWQIPHARGRPAARRVERRAHQRSPGEGSGMAHHEQRRPGERRQRELPRGTGPPGHRDPRAPAIRVAARPAWIRGRQRERSWPRDAGA